MSRRGKAVATPRRGGPPSTRGRRYSIVGSSPSRLRRPSRFLASAGRQAYSAAKNGEIPCLSSGGRGWFLCLHFCECWERPSEYTRPQPPGYRRRRTPAEALPWDEEAEQYCLAVALQNPHAAARLAATLCPDDFCLLQHRRLFSAMRELILDHRGFDALTLADYLEAQEWFAKAGGAAMSTLWKGFQHSSPSLTMTRGSSATTRKNGGWPRSRTNFALAPEAFGGGGATAEIAIGTIGVGPPVQVFYSAPELRDYVSPTIDWVIEKLLAKGVFTIFGGKPKAGKTTFVFGAVHAMLCEVPFMGLQTRTARILYITEQNKTTIRPKLDEYGLLD